MKDPYFVAVGNRLRETVREFGVNTAQELANMLGAERSQVSNWFTGVALPPVAQMNKLCAELKLSLDWIYQGDNSGLPLSSWIRISAGLKGQAVPDVYPEPASAPASAPDASRQVSPQSAARRVSKKPANG